MSPTQENLARALPDVASEARPAVAGQLDWVGMDNIELPVGWPTAAQRCARQRQGQPGAPRRARHPHVAACTCTCDRALSEEPLSACMLRRLLKDFLDSHAGLSDRAQLRIASS
jgi:GTP cyclohydrolase I